MKNTICLTALLILSLSLALPARAALEGDLIDGSATGLTTFNTGTETVVTDFDPEFLGTQDLYGDGNVVFHTNFFFSDEMLTIFIDHTVSGSTQFMDDFTVTFTDLDYVGSPSYVLTDVTSLFDSMGTGAGLAVNFTDDTLELVFTNFEIYESRELALGLVFEEGGGPSTPVVPVPAAAPMVLLGMGAIALARRIRRPKR